MPDNDVNVVFRPSKTQMQFIISSVLENCLVGPRGEGKTEAGIVAMVTHSTLQEEAFRPVPWAVVRDTFSNLERTTLQSFLNPMPGSFAHSIRDRLMVKDGGRRVILPGYFDAWFLGCDTSADLNKFQSLQLGGIWMEEVAPAAGIVDIGSGISEEVWLMGLTSLRHPVNTQRRAQITLNYPDESHWVWQRFHEFPDPARALFRIQVGENKFIDDQYRKNMRESLKDRPDMLARLVEGKTAIVQLGESVMPEYTDRHRHTEIYNVIKGRECFRFWDGGLSPACVIAQITPRGHFRVLDCLVGRNEGMIQLIKTQVIPILAQRYSGITQWRDFGDPTLKTPDQSNSSTCAAEIINSELGARFEGGISEWEIRRMVFKEALTREIEGQPMFMLSQHIQFLHRALKSGWHYHKTNQGVVVRDIPVKNEYSHPCDALSHGLPLLFKYKTELPNVDLSKYKTRSVSYGQKDLYGKGSKSPYKLF